MLVFVFFVLITCLIAGIFGIAHDQVTYSISPEYYIHFKFHQFQISEFLTTPPRLGVSLVGFLATWWTGLIIGGIIGLLGITQENFSSLMKVKFKSLIYVFLVTITFSVIGYFVGVIKASGMKDWPISYLNDGSDISLDYQIEKTIDIANFIKVEMIHNFSYLGGLAGLILGVFYYVRKSKSFHKSQ
ncbi:MAG: hypothetical protein ABF242_00960 [Flavobacteriales bacterium]